MFRFSFAVRPALLFLSLFLLAAGAGHAQEGDASPVTLDLYAPDLNMTAADPEGTSEGRVTGGLPGGWGDRTAWNKSHVDYSAGEDTDGGQKYLGVHVTELGNGPVTIRHLLPNYGDGTLFKLKIRARSATGTPVEFGIHQLDSPWKYVWSQGQTFGPSWQDAEYLFSLDHNTQPVAFWLDVKGVGKVDIASIKLEGASKEQLLSELKARYPDGGPKNILRTTRLPLGLQSGWIIDLRRNLNNVTEYDPAHPPSNRDPVVEPDAKAVGPSGFASLHLQSDDKIGVWTEPFAIPVPSQKYTASVYVKGTGSGELVVRRGLTVIAKKAFTASSDWQRVEAPFDTRFGEKFYDFSVEFSGELWLDAWQAGPGETAGPYVTQLPAEISLACVAKETGAERIQFDDEPAQVEYEVTAGPSPAPASGMTLHARVVDLYGETKDLPLVPLQAAAVNHGQFDFTAFPQHPLGAFRVETWVANANGKQVSPYQEIVIHRLHRPRYWGKDAPDSPFGIHVDADLPHVTIAKAIGINWARSHDAGNWWSGWYFLERQQGQWKFFDDAVDHYRKLHLKIFVSLATSPGWASAIPGKHNDYFDKFAQPKDPDQYINYVQTYATHYKGVIDAYEIWNEPWNAAWFAASYDSSKTGRMAYRPSDNQPAAFANLQKLAYAALKKIDPAFTVAGLNSTGTTDYNKSTPDISGRDWSLCLDALKIDEDCDVLSYHQYDTTFEGHPGDSIEKAYQVALGPFLARGVKKPVWLTEGSSLSGYIGSGFYHYTLPYVDAEDVWNTANRACRFPVDLLANHVAKSFIYSMWTYHSQYFGSDVESPWAGLLSEDGSLHPSGDAYSAMAWELEDTTFDQCVTMNAATYAFVFAGAGRSVAAIAPPEAGTVLTLPAVPGWKVTDLFGNPVSGTVTGNRLIYIEASTPAATLEQDLAKIQAAAAGS